MVHVSLQKTVTTMFIGDKNCLKAQILLAVRKAVVMVGLRLELVRMFKPVVVEGGGGGGTCPVCEENADSLKKKMKRCEMIFS